MGAVAGKRSPWIPAKEKSSIQPQKGYSLKGIWQASKLLPSAPLLGNTGPVKTSSGRRTKSNVSIGARRIVGSDRRPGLQIAGGFNDVNNISLTVQRELELAAAIGRRSKRRRGGR